MDVLRGGAVIVHQVDTNTTRGTNRLASELPIPRGHPVIVHHRD